MINWFKNMKRKQKEIDRLLEAHIKDKKLQLRNNAISLARDYKETIENFKISYKNIKTKYNITDEEINTFREDEDEC